MIQIEIFDVFGRWKYKFLRICWGPDRARSPQGPTRAQGTRRAPLGPRGAHQGPGPDARAKRALASSIYIYIYIHIYIYMYIYIYKYYINI